MTDETNVEANQSQNISKEPEQQEETTESIKGAVEDSKFTQQDVNAIVGKAKREAVERAFRDAAINNPNAVNTANNFKNQPSIAANNNSLTEDQIRSIAAEEMKRVAEHAQATQIANEFVQKMKSGSQKYEDFDSVVGQLDLPSIPQIVQLANSMDNTADIVYDIAKNPIKFSNLLMLSYSAPQMAAREMHRLSASIKSNETAKQQQIAPEPNSQIKPSPTGMDGGSVTLKDLKKIYRG